MALEFDPPKKAEKVNLELDRDVHAVLQKRIEAHNKKYPGANLTLAAAASSVLNDAVRKAEKRRRKGSEEEAEAAVSYNDAEYR